MSGSKGGLGECRPKVMLRLILDACAHLGDVVSEKLVKFWYLGEMSRASLRHLVLTGSNLGDGACL